MKLLRSRADRSCGLQLAWEVPFHSRAWILSRSVHVLVTGFEHGEDEKARKASVLHFFLLSSSPSFFCRWHGVDTTWFNCQATVMSDVAPESDSHRFPHYTHNNGRRWITALCPRSTHTQILTLLCKFAKGSHYLWIHWGILISSRWQETPEHSLSVHSQLI